MSIKVDTSSKKTLTINVSNWLLLIDQPLKPLLKFWFLADGSWKDRLPETKRGKGLELWEISITNTVERHRGIFERQGRGKYLDHLGVQEARKGWNPCRATRSFETTEKV